MEAKNQTKQNKSTTCCIQIKNFEFFDKSLNLQTNDFLVIKVSNSNKSNYSSLYRNKKRFFLFYIQENDYEFPPLYQDKQISYQFTQPGTYSIQSYNYPKLRIQIDVNESKISNNQTLTNLESISVQKQSIDNFLTSEDNTSIFSQFTNNDQGLMKISRCLQLLNNGFSPDSIKEKYQDIFINKNQTEQLAIKSSNKDINRSTSIDRLSKKSNSLKSNSKKSMAEEDFEDLRKVHQLNKLSPDSLFSLLTKIKRKYIKEEDDDSLRFNSIDEFSKYAQQNRSIESDFISKYNKKKLINFQNKIFNRFN